MGDASLCKQYMEALRQECLAKGIGGIKGLGVLFRGIDSDFNKGICYEEFRLGMRKYGIKRTENELKTLFEHFDKDRSSHIDFKEFLEQLRPPMPRCRVDVINEAFDKLDVIKDGVLKVDDLKEEYISHARKHPRYLNGDWTIDEVLRIFLDTFDSPDDKDGIVTRDEFISYYSGVSATVENDAYFDMMMRSCWGLPSKKRS